MGLLCDYFVAASDEQAASVIDTGVREASSPDVPDEEGSAWASLLARAGLRPPAPDDARTPCRAVVDGGGVEPTVQMGTVEALLTGRTVESVIDDLERDGIVAVRDGGECVVQRVSEGLVTALAEASPERLAEIAVPWSQTEEFWGQGDPDVLEGLLGQLAGLARTARAHGERVYCWVCV